MDNILQMLREVGILPPLSPLGEQPIRVNFNKPAPPPINLNPTATPTPTPAPVRATPTPDMRPLPTGTQVALDYIVNQTPRGQTPEQAFPVLGDKEFMKGIEDADKKRKGLANFLLLNAFHESTMGRNSNNIFGVKPGGKVAEFATPTEALAYQLSKNVLGGGANPNMNILGASTPLVAQDLINMMKSYNPEGAYVKNLLNVLLPSDNGTKK